MFVFYMLVSDVQARQIWPSLILFFFSLAAERMLESDHTRTKVLNTYYLSRMYFVNSNLDASRRLNSPFPVKRSTRMKSC